MRSVRKGFSEPELCASSRATAGGFFTAMSPPEETTSIKLVRPAMDLQQVTGTNAKWVPAWQLSEDGETWDSSTTAPKLFSTAIVSQNVEGLYYSQSGTGFEDVSANMNKKFCRWGVWALNNAGQNTLEFAQVAIRIEKKPC